MPHQGMTEPALRKRNASAAVLEALEAARAELDEREQKLEQREEALHKAVAAVLTWRSG